MAQLHSVDLLDLCILAYQLHAQTLVMRADPYGESQRSPGSVRGAHRRQHFMKNLGQVALPAPGLHGPGSLRPGGNWPTNDKLDPVLSDYRRITPHLPGFVQPDLHHENWIIYRVPTAITDPIGQVFMVEYAAQWGPHTPGPQLAVTHIPSPLVGPAPVPQPDLLYCFEGGTGATRAGATDGAVWSLMGFVLAREDQASAQAQKPYDVVIAFRGSRSGRFNAHHRAAGYYFDSAGSPDWVTDLDKPLTLIPAVHPTIKVHRGFATAVSTMLPAIKKALEEVRNQKGARLPRQIHVVGHSLGGGLATCFASAVLDGGFVPPGSPLANWPSWRTMNVTIFGAPPVGKDDFAASFNPRVDAEIWRLSGDTIPTFPRTLFRWVPTGRDIELSAALLPGNPKLGSEQAHSPDYIRAAMQAYWSQPQLGHFQRAADPHTPWKTEMSLQNLLNFYSTERARLAPANVDWFNLRTGFMYYLEALIGMLADSSDTKQRFDPNRKQNIQNIKGFVNTSHNAGANIAQLTQSVEVELRNAKLYSASDDARNDDVRRLIGHWFALAAAEGGHQWAPPLPTWWS